MEVSPAPSPRSFRPSTSSLTPSSSSIEGWGHFFYLIIFSKSPEAQLLVIELSVLLTTAFLVLLFVYGGIRRRVQVGGLNTLMKGVYILTPVSITYIIGLMHNASFRHELFPVWAFVLIYVYGGVDTITACDLSDNEQALQYSLVTIPLFFWGGWLGGTFLTEARLSIPLVVLFFMASWNGTETLRAFFSASKSKGLPLVTDHIVQYMRQVRDVPNEMEADPVSMRGYRYFVSELDDGSIITTEEIWRSQSRILRPTSIIDDKSFVRSERLKEIGLSFAWFWLLLRRFAGFSLHESSERRTSNFVQIGLLSLDPGRVDKLFRIIEVELEFVYDFFYTKTYVLAFSRFRMKLRRLVCVPFFLWFAFVTLYKHGLGHGSLSIKYRGHTLEIGVTRAVMVVIATLEIWQISIHFFSNWKILFLLCEYVKYPNSKKCFISKERLIICIWAIKDRLSRSNFLSFFNKPWQRKLGQYSFVESYAKDPKSRRPLTFLIGNLVKIPRVGQSGDSSVTLTTEVKCGIVSSLLTNSLALSPGTATLQRNDVLRKLTYAFQSETGAEVILISHIATSACEFLSTLVQKQEEDFKVATQISKYCAYLVSFAPELLPGHPYTAELVFDEAVQEALELFKGLDLEQRYHKMMTMTMTEGNGNSIVEQGCVLGRELMEHVIRDPAKGWSVLAQFWAELLLYMTPADNETAHGIHLAQGGEFITHLWALLTHAGVVTRDAFPAGNV